MISPRSTTAHRLMLFFFFFFNMLCLSFLVEACSFLLERIATVGLFRKPGSLPRIKTLRVRFHSCCFVLKKWCQLLDNFTLSVSVPGQTE